MNYTANNPDEYISLLPDDRKEAVQELRKILIKNLPLGIEESISHGMIGYGISQAIYPKGYHANPKEPLPFMSIASQKNHIALYHMGIYAFPEILAWFKEEYSRKVKTRLDMSKSCIRFKKPADIPYDLIAELCRKISLEDYIKRYEEVRKSQILGRKRKVSSPK